MLTPNGIGPCQPGWPPQTSRTRVETATHDWVASGADASFLFSGGRLELAEAWAGVSRFSLSDDERRFLDESRRRVDRDRAGRRRRRRIVIGGLALATVVALATASIAFIQRREANDQADETRARELAALATQAIDEDPERAILLALAALDRSDSPSAEVLSALHRATQSTRVRTIIPDVMGAALAQSPDGSLLAADHLDGSGLSIIDPVTGAAVTDISTPYPISPLGLAFDPTGELLAAGYGGGDGAPRPAVELFDVDSGRAVSSLPGEGAESAVLQFDESGRWLGGLLAPAGPDAWGAVVWDTEVSAAPRSFGPASDIEFAGDTPSVVVLSWEGTGLEVFDPTTGEQTGDIPTPDGVTYFEFEVDPTGRIAALVSILAGRVDIVELDGGELIATIPNRAPAVAQFSADGRTLAVTGDDSAIRIYDTDQFVERLRLTGTSGSPAQVLFAPDGTGIVSARPGEIRTWDISATGNPELGNFQVAGGLLDRIAVATDEDVAYATAYTNFGQISTVHRIDLTTGVDDDVLGDVRYYFSTRPIVSPDLSVVAAPDEDFVTSLVRLPAGGSTVLARCESVRAFAANGRLAAVDGQLVCNEVFQEAGVASRIVDTRSGATVLDLGGTVIFAAAFGPPGDDGRPQLVLIEDRDTGSVTLYDVATGEPVGTHIPDDFVVSLAMSPDGQRFGLLTLGGRLLVFDVARVRAGDDQSDAIVFDIAAHNAGSNAVDISESGFIATGSSADGIRVWSPDGEIIASVTTGQADAPTFDFATGTDTLYYEDGDGVVRRFAIDATDVAALARSVVSRGFTPQECTRYFIDEPCPTFGT